MLIKISGFCFCLESHPKFVIINGVCMHSSTDVLARISLILPHRSKDGIVNIWSLNGSGPPNSDMQKPLKISYFSKPEQGDLTSLDWNFDGSLLAIGSYDSILRIVTTTGKLYFSHRQHEVGESQIINI
jgi:WD40 repeat protein